MARRRQFRDLLPFYVNGTLSEAQKEDIEEYLAANSSARDEYLFTDQLARAARLHGEQRDPMAGYALFKARLDASRPLPLSRLRQCGARLRAWGFSPALAVSLLVGAVQLAWISNFLPTREPVMRSLAQVPLQQQAWVKLTIKSGARFGDVVGLLTEQNCRIVWGPTAAGELWLVLESAQDDTRARAALAASPLVEDVLELAQP